MQVVLEEIVVLLERKEPKLSKRLFQRVARRATHKDVLDFQRGLAAAGDVEACHEALSWIAGRLAGKER